MLTACFVSQKTYGQNPDRIGEVVKTFQFILDGYSLDNIRNAFIQHLRQSKDFPTPADIINIINPPKEKISTVAYMSAKKRRDDSNGYYYKGMLDDEDLIKEYETSEIEKIPAKNESLAIEDSRVGDLISNLTKGMN